MLDLLVTLKLHDDVWADESELYIGQPENFWDLFNLIQSRASRRRLLDMLRRPHHDRRHVFSEACWHCLSLA